jgi:4-amino-4-deoxy-L-arabinose transferase-like glycosyltransferase
VVSQKFFRIAFFLILALGLGLRVVGFEELLVFKSDQARDALLMENVFSGESIPLLGPQVGGTPLRLGPVTYYFQYLSGLLFGSTPESLAYPDLFFGILILPLLFLFLRRFFSIPLSLGLMALGSVSFVLVTFSRFAWNPNSLPFFTTLFAYAFLVAEESIGRRRWLFLAVCAVALGIIFQLHVAASFGIVLGLIAYLLWYRSFSFREVFGVMFIVVLLHAPVIVSEVRSGGENVGFLKEEFSERGVEPGKHNFLEKGFRSFQQGTHFVWLLTTGHLGPENIETRGFMIKCDKGCRQDIPLSVTLLTFVLVLLWFARKQFVNTHDDQKRRELVFLLLWLIGFFLFTVPIAYELETRFYLGIIAPLFVFLGLAFQYLEESARGKFFKYLLYGGIASLILVQLQVTSLYLYEMSRASTSSLGSHEDLRFGTAPKVTLGQLRRIASSVDGVLEQGTPVFISGENLYVKSLYYVLSHEYGFRGCYMRGEKNAVPIGMNHVLLRYTGESETERLPDEFQSFGTLSVSVRKALDAEAEVIFPSECLTY